MEFKTTRGFKQNFHKLSVCRTAGDENCRESAGKVMKLCGNKPNCKDGEKCKFAHNEKELERWKKGNL